MDIEDALSLRQLSKVEEYPSYLFVIFHLLKYDKTTKVSIRKQWSAFLGDKYLVTLHPRELSALDEFSMIVRSTKITARNISARDPATSCTRFSIARWTLIFLSSTRS